METHTTRSVVLIVSAFPPEQNFLLRAMERERQQGLVDFLCSGIGSVRAAAGVSAYLAMRPVSRVVFCGTAGAYDKGLPLLSVVRARKAVFADGAALFGQAYLPPGKKTHEVLASSLPSGLGAGTDCCVSPAAITTDLTLAQKFATLGQVENLELYGMAMAASLAGLPWEGFLGVSNFVGPDAHREWKALHLKASENAGLMLLQLARQERWPGF